MWWLIITRKEMNIKTNTSVTCFLSEIYQSGFFLFSLVFSPRELLVPRAFCNKNNNNNCYYDYYFIIRPTVTVFYSLFVQRIRLRARRLRADYWAVCL